ncbi:helix-hairpin-helix domain-containing protein [Halostella litorea]|uniref:helix-hairpin-helix domain-containing protein n=1 Tax=Halostella litorea TaxID=2528831 RepID=UPI001091E4C9|nr:helix-hairpin-helix domain-containing protein [Halostella litorea]
MTHGSPDWLTVFILALAAASVLYDHLQSDPDPVEQAKRAYENGDITRQELERRLELHLDERNARIRAAVEQVNGVGPATSKAIAREFASIEAVANADRAELEAVPGVGEDRARAILEYLRA